MRNALQKLRLTLPSAGRRSVTQASKFEVEKTSGAAAYLGIAASFVTAYMLVDETINLVVGASSTSWPRVEGTIVGPPELTTSGAMIKRRELGVPYEFVIPIDDDDDDDDDDEEEDDGERRSATVYSVPRRGIVRGMFDWILPPRLDGKRARHLEEAFPVGSKVWVYYSEGSETENSCLVPGVPYPHGPTKFVAYAIGMPLLISVARSALALPARFALFTLSTLLWTGIADQLEDFIFEMTPLSKFGAKKPKWHAGKVVPEAETAAQRAD